VEGVPWGYLRRFQRRWPWGGAPNNFRAGTSWKVSLCVMPYQICTNPGGGGADYSIQSIHRLIHLRRSAPLVVADFDYANNTNRNRSRWLKSVQNWGKRRVHAKKVTPYR
jgi:hypothetical protein